MMQGYRNFPGRYDVIADKEARRQLWYDVFDGLPLQSLFAARQILVWHQLWRRNQALVPMIEPWIVSWAINRVLAALDEGGAA